MNKMIEALQEEVYFWQYMVNEYQDRQSMPEYRRILEALALAEFKLEQYVQVSCGKTKIEH